MSIETLVFQVIVAWVLVASAVYYGSLQALDVYFDRPADGEHPGPESGNR